MSVVVRRYTDILIILLIPTPFVLALFFTEASLYTSLFIFEMFFRYFTKYIKALNCMEKQMCSYCPYFLACG